MKIIDAKTFEAEELARRGSAVPAAVKYSKLAIIRALGDAWPEFRVQLEERKLLDQFFAAEYLASDDPVFAAFIDTVPEELRARLEECIWKEE